MKILLLLSSVLIAMPSVFAQSTTITWTTTYQTMDGFGGEDSSTAESLTDAQANMFFSPSAGIGLAIVRTGNYGCPATGSCSVSTSNVPDLVTLQKATARGAIVDLNIQSPPANLKYSGDFTDGTAGANGTCLPTSNYSAFATYTAQWITMLKSNNVPISLINVANEPDSPSPATSSLGACFWTAAGLDTYIGSYLGPALAGLNVKVMMANEGFWFGGASGDLYSTCLADATCNQYVGYVAMQAYGNTGAPDGFGTGYCCSTATTPPSIVSPYHIWQSEVNGGATYNSTAGLWNWDPSISDAMVWARNINDYITIGNVSGWEYWQLSDCCPFESGAPFNDGLTLADLSTTSKRFYVVGNWSKFVRPGWVRIDTRTNTQSGVYVSAFKETLSGKFAIVAVNQNSASVNVNFSLSGFPAVTAVTPTVTSADVNLVDQADASVSSGGFSYSLPATSVVTFHGTASATATGLPPPTHLALTVH